MKENKTPFVQIPLEEYNDLITCRKAMQLSFKDIKSAYSIKKYSNIEGIGYEYVAFFNETESMNELIKENVRLKSELKSERKQNQEYWYRLYEAEKQLKRKKFLGIL